MAASQDTEARYSMGSSAKAMKLLGLTKLPPNASRAEHLSMIQQHRSVRLERAKSASPMSLQRGGSASRLVSSNSYSASVMAAGPGSYHSVGNGGPVITSRGGPQVLGQHPGAGAGTEGDDEEEEALAHHYQQQQQLHYQQQQQQQQQQTSEWLDMRESSLKLTPTDADEQFIRRIEELMNQFPEPPSRGCVPGSNLSSPTTPIVGRNRWDNGGSSSNRRGFHMPKSSSHWRVGGGGGGGGDGSDMGSSGELVHQRQNPMYVQQQDESRREHGGHESTSPVRICYAKPEDVFSL